MRYRRRRCPGDRRGDVGLEGTAGGLSRRLCSLRLRRRGREWRDWKAIAGWACRGRQVMRDLRGIRDRKLPGRPRNCCWHGRERGNVVGAGVAGRSDRIRLENVSRRSRRGGQMRSHRSLRQDESDRRCWRSCHENVGGTGQAGPWPVTVEQFVEVLRRRPVCVSCRVARIVGGRVASADAVGCRARLLRLQRHACSGRQLRQRRGW